MSTAGAQAGIFVDHLAAISCVNLQGVQRMLTCSMRQGQFGRQARLYQPGWNASKPVQMMMAPCSMTDNSTVHPCLQVGERQAFDLGFEEEKTGSYLPSERSDSQAGGKGSSTKLGSTGVQQAFLTVGGGGSRAYGI